VAISLTDVFYQHAALTLTSIFKQNGIQTILKSVQIASKSSTDNTAARPKHFEPLGLNEFGRSNKTRIKKQPMMPVSSRSNSKNSLSRAGSMGSVGSIASINTSESRDSHINNDKSDKATNNNGQSAIPCRTVDIGDEDSIINGLLSKYYDPRFFQQMEKMDKTTRAEIIKHLLVLFEKVDRLLAVSSCISLDVDLDEAIDRIVTEAGNILQCQHIIVYLVETETKELIYMDYDPWMDPKEKELMMETKIPAGTGIAGYVSQTLETVNIRDASNHEHFDASVDARGAEMGANTLLCVPLVSKDSEVKGVIIAINKVAPNGAPQMFNHEDEYLLKTLANQAGIIINNAQMYDQMKKTQKKVEVLLETTRSLGSTLQLDLLVKMIMDAAKELLNADRCTLFLIDSKGKQLRAHIQGRDIIQEIRIPMNSGIAGFVFTSGSE
jgi:GAF domain-containing protein